MTVRLHRCPLHFAKSNRHPCWKVQHALDEAGIAYEIETQPFFRWRRTDYRQRTGTTRLPAIEFDDGSILREESDLLAARIREGRLDPKGATPDNASVS